jgi:hypothetical protein
MVRFNQRVAPKKAALLIGLLAVLSLAGLFLCCPQESKAPGDAIQTAAPTADSSSASLTLSGVRFTLPSGWKVTRQTQQDAVVEIPGIAVPIPLSIEKCEDTGDLSCFGSGRIFQEKTAQAQIYSLPSDVANVFYGLAFGEDKPRLFVARFGTEASSYAFSESDLALISSLLESAAPTSEERADSPQESAPVPSLVTKDWKTYTDKLAGFSFRYPSELTVEPSVLDKDTKPLSLYALPTKIEELDGPLGNDQESARSIMESLVRGEYGERIDCAWPDTQPVVNLGKVNAQKYTVLSCIDTCGIEFQKKLLFFNKGYRIVILLSAPGIKKSDPDYFESDGTCWKDSESSSPGSERFHADLEAGRCSPNAQEWRNIFENIVKTVRVE